MTRPQRPEHETHRDRNGLAQDTSSTIETATSRITQARPEYQGYFLLVSGALILLFSLGLLPVLKWLMVALSIGMIIWGVFRSNLIQRATDYFQRGNKRSR
jgi:hypothetical protein